MLKIAIIASRRGWRRTSEILLEIDLYLDGLGGASRELRREKAKRRASRLPKMFEARP